MNKNTTTTTTASSRFVLTRKNQKGQVAIFVALIFQVIFVFFALLVNVGLLVHQKINLQHSTDLAAYYGAMKQAENMNAIAHVNFQIRQAWKLLTWRYRVLGTFGFRKGDASPNGSQNYPFEHVGGQNGVFFYNGTNGSPPGGAANMKCANAVLGAETLGVQDIPFFCVGHSGFASWPQSESQCQLNCDGFTSARVIDRIPLAGTATTPFGGNVAGSVNTAITSVNANLTNLCKSLGPTGAILLSRFIAAYINDSYPRIKTVEALGANLALEADKLLDIEGNLIQSGSKLTLKNNLTEANLSGFLEASFKAENGFGNGKGKNNCGFSDGVGLKPEFLKKIEINFVNYFIHNCDPTNVGTLYKPQNVYDPNSPTGLGSAFDVLPNQLKTVLLSVLQDRQKHTVGYEKNPYCVEYYAVKASSEPQIPFLPLTKIKLNAVAVAKPFGGSIGPWYGKTWPKGSPISAFDDTNPATKTDETLPIKDLTGVAGAADLTKSVYSQPNFSLFVGDVLGLRNLDYIAAYHSALAMRDFNNYDTKTYKSNIQNPATAKLRNTGTWPDYKNWDGLDDSAVGDFRDYDSLATNNDNDAGTRALEISAIAPNQFDITHYSIEPDFYNNYYRKLYNGGLAKILAATNRTEPTLNQLRADFGAVGMRADQTNQPPPLTPRSFSVKDQIILKNLIFNINPSVTNGLGAPNKTYTKVFNYLVSLQSSLLTSWTFLNFSKYDVFPAGPVDIAGNTMSFGQCFDSWNKTVSADGDRVSLENFKTPMDTNPAFPPTPGNCVTGGRTGYSVKLVSPNIVRDDNNLDNTLPDSFFNF